MTAEPEEPEPEDADSEDAESEDGESEDTESDAALSPSMCIWRYDDPDELGTTELTMYSI